MFTRYLTRLTKRKFLGVFCMFVTGAGMLLVLLAVVGGILHFLNPQQADDAGLAILLRFLGGIVLLAVGFSGLVLGAADDKESLPPWSEERNRKMLLIKIRCSSCRALNEEESVYCRECGADL